MTWSEAMNFVEAERKKLEPLQYVLRVQSPGANAATVYFEYFAAESRSDWRLNRAIRHFAQTRQWPELTSETRYFLWLRLDWAERLLGWLLRPEFQYGLPIPQPLDDARLLEWLLDFAWQDTGRSAWQAQEKMGLFEKQSGESGPAGGDERAGG